MKKITLSIFTLALALSAQADKLDRSVRPKPAAAPEVKLGKPESFTLPNGMRVFVVENHKLPTVSCNIELDIKPELEGASAGYRDMMSELLTSGTKTRSNEQLNKEIDFIGANIAASHDEVSGSSLKKHMDKLMVLMSDIAINADFKQEELEKIKTRTLSGLEAAKNQPDDMLRNVTAVTNFGKGHPYGEVADEASVSKITLADCKKYYSTYFRPNVAYMAVVGDVTPAEVKAMVEKYFGGWQKAEVPAAAYSNPAAPAKTNVVFVPRDGAVQSVINVTYPIDLLPGTPDVLKAKVASSILGGGSTGRLFLNLREKHGWTYGSYSSINQDEMKGSFTAFAKCRNIVSDSSVGEILNEMKRMQTEKVGSEELQNTLNFMSGSFAISLENPQTIAQYAINIERYKMPADYYQNYLKNLNAVTAEDVQAMSVKYINPANANIVVVGSKADVAKTMEKFGTVAYVDNYGKAISENSLAAIPAGVNAADILKKHIAAIGGEKAIRGVKDIKIVSKGKLNYGGQEMPITVTEMKKAPNKMKSAADVMGHVVSKQVFDGTAGYVMQEGAPKKTMSADEIESAKVDADIYAELNADKLGVKRTVKGMDKVNDADAYVVEAINAKGKKVTEYYDAKTAYLVRKIEISEEGADTKDYSNYKEVAGSNGYKIPYTLKETSGPVIVNVQVETVDINKGIVDTEFN